MKLTKIAKTMEANVTARAGVGVKTRMGGGLNEIGRTTRTGRKKLLYRGCAPEYK
jgi:hypothetical protein